MIKQTKRGDYRVENRTGWLEHEGDRIGAVIGLDGDDVIIASAAQHFGHVVEIHAHGEVAVAAVVLKALWSEQESYQRHVAGVHGLEGKAGGGTVEVGVVDQLPHRIENLLEKAPLNQPQLQHLLFSTLLLVLLKSNLNSLARKSTGHEEESKEMKGRDLFRQEFKGRWRETAGTWREINRFPPKFRSEADPRPTLGLGFSSRKNFKTKGKLNKNKKGRWKQLNIRARLYWDL